VTIPYSVRYKIARALHHLQEFQTESQRYFQTNPGKVVRQPEGKPDEFIGKIETDGPLPARFPLIIGDFLQNLRSSLDYLIWELVIAAKNQPGKHNMFPICTNPEFFNTLAVNRRRLEGVTTDAITEVESLQPYHAGNSALHVMDDLCNINKHRRVLLTYLHGGIAPKDMESKVVDGDLFAKLDFGHSRKDATIGPFPIIDGPQGPGLKVDMDLHLIAFIAFNEGTTEDMEVGLVSKMILEYVCYKVMPRFEQFF
jgi:hypothetical protein